MLEKIIELLKAQRDILNDLIFKTEHLNGGILRIQEELNRMAAGRPDAKVDIMMGGGSKSTRRFPLPLADAVAIAIKGTPATTAEILKLLKESGRSVGGKKPAVTLYSALSRSKKIRRLPGKKWGSLI